MANQSTQTWNRQEGRILLIEDDELIGKPIKDKVERANIQCDWAVNSSKAKEALGKTTYHAVVADIYLESDKPEGLELIRIASENGIPSIIITSRLDVAVAKQGLNNGADYVIEKPFEIQQLLHILQELWENPKGLIGRRERFLEIHSLTEKEKELTRLLLKGLSNQEIADVAETSLATVKYYTNQIFQKFDVKSRAELFNLVFPT